LGTPASTGALRPHRPRKQEISTWTTTARLSRRPGRRPWAERANLKDFTVGDFYRHPLGRTVLDVDNAWLTLLTQNTAAVHFDRHYASGTQWGKPLVDSTVRGSFGARG
jgi:itaconyl-CoA hydratase